MTERNVFETGRLWGRTLWGKDRFDRMEKSAEEMHPGFRDLSLVAWSLFSRPPLEPKVRSLCVVAALAALGREDELRLHVFGALSNGATPEEVTEAIMQITPYAGLPKGRSALLMAGKCFPEYRPPTDEPR